MRREAYNFFPCDREKIAHSIGKEGLIAALRSMLLIRNFEQRGEAAYQQGKVGGFYHSYMGQEAIQTGCVAACGKEHWFTTTYRCHALALLLGVTPDEAMAELYGKSTGIAGGKGGSMHMYADRLLGGLAIVGGHVPIATGAAFSIKYLKKKGLVSFCFLGDGAVPQGAVHESLNLASLWDLPCIYVIENNQWGMGTAVKRAVCVEPIAETMAKSYNMDSYTLDGMDFLHCYAGFQAAKEAASSRSRPVLIEAVAERFRGHSISDPGLYRSKEDLQKCMELDPIQKLAKTLFSLGWLDEKSFEAIDAEEREKVLQAMQFAEKSPWPDPITLEEGVFAPPEERRG